MLFLWTGLSFVGSTTVGGGGITFSGTISALTKGGGAATGSSWRGVRLAGGADCLGPLGLIGSGLAPERLLFGPSSTISGAFGVAGAAGAGTFAFSPNCLDSFRTKSYWSAISAVLTTTSGAGLFGDSKTS